MDKKVFNDEVLLQGIDPGADENHVPQEKYETSGQLTIDNRAKCQSCPHKHYCANAYPECYRPVTNPLRNPLPWDPQPYDPYRPYITWCHTDGTSGSGASDMTEIDDTLT